MSKDAKNAEITKHKGKAPGRGKKFPVEITEQVGVPVQRLSIGPGDNLFSMFLVEVFWNFVQHVNDCHQGRCYGFNWP